MLHCFAPDIHKYIFISMGFTFPVSLIWRMKHIQQSILDVYFLFFDQTFIMNLVHPPLLMRSEYIFWSNACTNSIDQIYCCHILRCFVVRSFWYKIKNNPWISPTRLNWILHCIMFRSDCVVVKCPRLRNIFFVEFILAWQKFWLFWNN